MDKDLKVLRNNRAKAFSDMQRPRKSREDDADRKATIVIEHLIQASDVSHTMQHWHIYRKWNARLFELYRAFVDGRSGNDPSSGTRARWAFLTHHPVGEEAEGLRCVVSVG
jgi:hypothetical protein